MSLPINNILLRTLCWCTCKCETLQFPSVFFLGREPSQILWKRVSNMHLNVLYPHDVLADNISRKAWKCLQWTHCFSAWFAQKHRGLGMPLHPSKAAFPRGGWLCSDLLLHLPSCHCARPWHGRKLHFGGLSSSATTTAPQPCYFCQAAQFAFAARAFVLFPCSTSCSPSCYYCSATIFVYQKLQLLFLMAVDVIEW